MDFQLDDEQSEFQKLAREFGERELALRAHVSEQAKKIPTEILDKAFNTGLMNVQVPESLGGLGLNLWNACLISEGLASGCSGISSAIEFSAFAQLPLIVSGSIKQQEKFLQPLNDALSFGGIDLDSLFDATALTVTRRGEELILNGLSKRMLNATIASWYVLFAQDITSGKVIPLVVSSRADGVVVKSRVASVGRTIADVATVSFDNVAVSEIIECTSVEDFKQNLVEQVNVLIAAGLTGVAQSALDNAVRYANERKTFGKNISQHQSIGFMLADMAKDIAAARLLTHKAAVLIDNKIGCYGEAFAAHSFAGEIAMKAAVDAVQIYGGYGYSKEYPVEKLMRDVKAYQTLTTGSHMLKSHIGGQLLATI